MEKLGGMAAAPTGAALRFCKFERGENGTGSSRGAASGSRLPFKEAGCRGALPRCEKIGRGRRLLQAHARAVARRAEGGGGRS